MSELADGIEAGGSAAVVASAVELGLIESLSDPAPAAEHASRLGLDPEATGLELSGRVELVAADYHSIEFPGEAFDRVLLANVLHLEPPRSARSLVRAWPRCLVVCI